MFVKLMLICHYCSSVVIVAAMGNGVLLLLSWPWNSEQDVLGGRCCDDDETRTPC